MKRGYKVKREARSKQTEPLTQVLPRLLSSMGKDKEKTYRYQLLLCHWEDVVGATVAAHVRPVRMDFRKLFLAADAPVWANELRYMERQIIDKINAFVCDELVTSIVFCAPRSEYFKSSQAEKSASSPEEVIVPIREDIEKAEKCIEQGFEALTVEDPLFGEEERNYERQMLTYLKDLIEKETAEITH